MRSILYFLVGLFCISAFVDAWLNKGFLRFRNDLLLDRQGQPVKAEKLATSYAFMLKVPKVPKVPNEEFILRVTFVCNGCQEKLILPKSSTGIPSLAAFKDEGVQRSSPASVQGNVQNNVQANGQANIQGNGQGYVRGKLQRIVRHITPGSTYRGTMVDLVEVDIKRSFRNLKQFVIADQSSEWYHEVNQGANQQGETRNDGSSASVGIDPNGRKVIGYFVIKPDWRSKYGWWSSARSFAIVIKFGNEIHDPEDMVKRMTATYELDVRQVQRKDKVSIH